MFIKIAIDVNLGLVRAHRQIESRHFIYVLACETSAILSNSSGFVHLKVTSVASPVSFYIQSNVTK